jgi:hypothetical protein
MANDVLAITAVAAAVANRFFLISRLQLFLMRACGCHSRACRAMARSCALSELGTAMSVPVLR